LFLTSILNTREILNYHGNKYESICLLAYDVVQPRSYIYIFICVCCLLHICPDYEYGRFLWNMVKYLPG